MPPDSVTNTSTGGRNRWSNRMVSLFYRNKLDSLGSRLDIGYSYTDYHNIESNDIINHYFSASGSELHSPDGLSINNSLYVDIHALNTDLEQQLPGKVTLNAGVKYSHSDTRNAINYANAGLISRLQSNQFLYRESIFGLYGSGAKE